MAPRVLALVVGLLYTGLGVLGLMPGALAGLFPASPLLGAAHLAMGAWGLAAYGGPASAPTYARCAAFIFAVLGLAGMLAGIERFPLPLHGPLVWLHLATAGAAGFVGWRPRGGERRGLAGDRRRAGAVQVRRASAVQVESERRHGIDDRRKAPAPA
jgi:hypothetical protein